MYFSLNLVGDDYLFEKRGEMKQKGKGFVYFLFIHVARIGNCGRGLRGSFLLFFCFCFCFDFYSIFVWFRRRGFSCYCYFILLILLDFFVSFFSLVS